MQVIDFNKFEELFKLFMYIDLIKRCICLQVIDFNKFEELFKLGNLTLDDADGDAALGMTRKGAAKKVETVSLLEANRLRNVGMSAQGDARGCERMQGDVRGCKRMQGGVRGCKGMSGDARGYARGCERKCLLILGPVQCSCC